MASHLADIYTLLVEKGASPLLGSERMRNASALHVAVRCNNYDLVSMMMFGAHLLLTCDDRVAGWNIPDNAWGCDEK